MGDAVSETEGLKTRIAAVRSGGRRLHRDQSNALDVVEGYTASMDDVVVSVAKDHLDDGCAVVAVGGYGRRELCPFSDTDLLFLRPSHRDTPGIERLIRLLWDAGLEPGHSLRTPAECYGSMLDDPATATCLLEARFVCGDADLYQTFTEVAVERFRRRRRRPFVLEQLREIRASLDDPARTIYAVEPNVKDGACGLRDIQRVRWIENLCSGVSSLDALLVHGDFSRDSLEALRSAYTFLLRVRFELHLVNGVRVDVLERDVQPLVAQHLGYGADHDDVRGAVEGLMGDYYRHSRAVLRFLRYYSETETRGRRFFSGYARKFLATRVNPYLAEFRGRLYLTALPPKGGSADEILEVFSHAQSRGARLSEALCETMRGWVAADQSSWTHSGSVVHAFVAILRRGDHVGRLLKTMHETRVLERIIPEFKPLDCLVSFDGHHHFTVDEHTLKTLRELDRIASDHDYPFPEFKRVYDEIASPLALRLALLLHDIGKAYEGNHSVTGVEMALGICDRLGFRQQLRADVEFLVYQHLELFKVSERRDVNEPGVLEGLANLVQSEERLKMLYLLTYIDIVSVGPGTWTRWKGAQLQELYEKTRLHFQSGDASNETVRGLLVGSHLSAEEQELLLDHCTRMNTPTYHMETPPERMLAHVQRAEDVKKDGRLQVALESYGDYHEVFFCGEDRANLFVDLAGLLFSEGFDVLSARIHSRDDGIAIDQFYVEIADGVRISAADRLERLQAKIDRLSTRRATMADLVRQRARDYKVSLRSKPLFGARVVVRNDVSELLSVIEVSAADRPGLLFDLASTLHHLNLDVRMAKVSTAGERVRDSFYVVEVDGSKIENPARRQEIEQSMKQCAQTPPEMLTAHTP